MKKGKWAALAVAVAALSSVAIACDNSGGTNQEHQHTYGEWVITTEPTETTGGVATRYCTGDDKTPDTFDLPKLTDTSVWTVDAENSVDAGHGTEGKIVYTSDYGDVEIIVPAEAHAYGAWKLTKEPTLTEKGKAQRECAADGEKETVDVAKLSDTSVWTKDAEKSEAPTHFKAGKDVYKSVYGEVAIALDSIPHAYGDWTMTKAPTLTEAGEAERVCADDNEKDIVEVAKLSDTNVWTKAEFDADYNAGGRTEYTSMFGKIVFEDENAPKLVAPYDGKTYYGIPFEIKPDRLNKKVEFETAWLNQYVALDENATGVSNGSLFGSTGKGYRILMRDYDKGLISLNELDEAGEIAKSTTAYLDVKSGIFVFPRTSFGTVNTEPVIATPFDTDAQLTQSKVKASAWTVGSFTALSISYTTRGGDTYNIFIYDNEVYFGVDFKTSKDASGTAIAGDACYNAKHLYVMRGDDQLFAFAYTGTEMVVADGYEGRYTGKLDADENDVELVVSGYGVFEGISGSKYEIAAKGENYTLGAYIDGSYYELTLGDDGTFTSVKPMVTITIVSDYGDFDEKVAQLNKNIEVPLADDLTDVNMFFGGWFTDATFKTPVKLTAGGGYIPTADATLYAKWTKKLIVTTVIDGVEEPIEYGEGDELGLRLPSIAVDEEKNRMFVGWFMDGAFKIPAPLNAAITAADGNVKVYAKFETLPAYYGTRTGMQLLSGGIIKRAEITIDERGKISGSIFTGESDSEKAVTGTVRGYDENTGLLTYTTDGADARYMWLDAKSGLLAIPADLTSAEVETHPFVLSKDSVAIGAHVSFNFHNGGMATARTKIIEYGNGKLAFLYNNKIYGDVSAKDAYGAVLSDANSVNNAKQLIVECDGQIVAAFGTTAASFITAKDELAQFAVLKSLDAYYGEYVNGGVTMRVDGLGKLAWGGKTADYTKAADGSFDVYVYEIEQKTTTTTDDEGYEDVVITYYKVVKEYYRLTLDAAQKSFDIEKVNVMVTYDINLPNDAEGADGVATTTESINANIEFNLSKKLENIGNYVFEGWYADAACTQKLTSLSIAQDKRVYAKWLEKITITLNINREGAAALNPVYVGKGLTVDIDDPEGTEEVSFIGWFTDAACTQAWNAKAPVTADIQLWAKWGTPAYMHSYIHYYVVETDGQGTDTKDYRGVVTFDAQGFSSDGGYPFNKVQHQITECDEENGTLVFTGSTTQIGLGEHYGFIDVQSGLMVINVSVGDASDVDLTKLLFLVPTTVAADNSAVTNWGESYWNDGKSRAISFVSGSTKYNTFVHNNRAYFNVSFKTVAGDDVDGKDCYKSSTLYVRDGAGALIAKFGYDGSVMNELDGYEDITYTGSLGDLTVNGVSVVNVGGKTGSYSLTNGGTYTADAYIDNVYYELILDKAEQAYTVVKRMVTLSYDTDYDAANATGGSVNKNIGITLPVLTDQAHVFRGWFADEACTVAVTLTDGKFVPTADATTLYAKWDAKVTLTVVYATIQHEGITGMPNVVTEYGAGDSVTLVEPAFTNGKTFGGWFADAKFSIPFNEGDAITADTTVYCKWIDGVAMYGTYYGWNFYGTTAKTISPTTTSSTKIEISTDGSVTGKKSGNVLRDAEHEYDSATGAFYVKDGDSTHYYAYDAASGAIGVAFNSSAVNFNEDMYLLFKKLIKSGENSVTFGSKALTDGKLLSLVFADGSTENLFVTSTRIFSGVTWTATDANGNAATYSAKNVGDASTVTVYDRSGNIIIRRGKDGSTWKDLDDYAGEYSGDLGALKFNGVGGVTLDGVAAAGKYTIVDGDYTADVYVNGCYYQVTLNKSGSSYAYVKPMATVTFVSAHSTHDAVSANVNISIDLPTVETTVVGDFKFKGWYASADYSGAAITTFKPASTDAVEVYARWVEKVDIVYDMGGHGEKANDRAFPEERFTLPAVDTITADGWVFRGWYSSAALTGSAVTYVTPTAGKSTTVYAKWDEVVTLTVVYATEADNAAIAALPNGTFEFGSGDTVTLQAPEETGGKVFGYWYTLVDGEEVVYKPSKITADMTVYCKWISPVPMYGSYNGFNLYGSTAGKTHTSFKASFNCTGDGSITGRGSGAATDITDDTFMYENGKRYVAYDAEYGIVAEKYSANNATLGNDFNIYFKGNPTSVDASVNLVSSGWASVLTVTRDGETFNVLVYNDKVYGGVTWNDGVSALDTKDVDSLVVKDADGNVIVTIAGKVATAGSAA